LDVLLRAGGLSEQSQSDGSPEAELTAALSDFLF
jgi:hypothetical protein